MASTLGRFVDRINAALVAARTRGSGLAASAGSAPMLDALPGGLFGERSQADALAPRRTGAAARSETWRDAHSDWEALRLSPRGDGAADALIVLHGWLAVGLQQMALRAFMSPLRRGGMEVWYPWLPAHGSRTPPGRVSGAECLSSDLPATAAAIRQGVAETVELAEWLRARGQSVSIVGFSLGGWIAGLAATEWPHFRRAVLFTPVSDPARSFAESPLVAHIRQDLAESGITAERAAELLAPVSLQQRALSTPAGQVLIVGARDDNVVAADSLEQLARTWECPVSWLHAGHITSQWSLDGRRVTREWLAPDLSRRR